MKQHFPSVDVFLDLEIDEIGQHLLIYLNSWVRANGGHNRISRYNTTYPSNPALEEYAGAHKLEVGMRLNEGWMWLTNEGFIAPSPENPSFDSFFVTKKGQAVQDREDLHKFDHLRLLPKSSLDRKLVERVLPIFVRRDFDTSVFAAFKEVEVRMRNASKQSSAVYGVELARKAFNPDDGPLTDTDNPDASERQSLSHIFAGAIGAFKNPGSHRDVDYDDPVVAASLILFANTLVKIIDARGRAYDKRLAEERKIQASY